MSMYEVSYKSFYWYVENILFSVKIEVLVIIKLLIELLCQNMIITYTLLIIIEHSYIESWSETYAR